MNLTNKERNARRRKVIKNPPKYVILGPVKCGQCSLQDYYNKKNPDFKCLRLETIWTDNGMAEFLKLKEQYPDIIPVIITRDVPDAVVSYYNYFKRRPEMTFEEFLDWPINHHRHGQLPNILYGYDFDKWIKKWSSVNPIVVSLEEMKKDPDFDHVNKTKVRVLRHNKGLRVPHKLTPEQRQLVLEKFNKIASVVRSVN